MSVRHALLALLSEGPKYGLQLREEFEARTGEVWPLNVGQVYTTLQRLERDGLIESDGTAEDSPQRGFRITAEGAEELAGWLRTPPDLTSPPRDELVMKVLVALRLSGVDVHDVIQVHRRYLEELAGWLRTPLGLTSQQREELVIKVLVALRLSGVDVHDVIQVHRRYLVELMQQWTHLKEDEAEQDLPLALVIDAELFRLDSVIRWLDSADGRLKRAASDSVGSAGPADSTDSAAPVGAAPIVLPRMRRRTGVRR